jgi:hypothetical protein
MDSDQNEFSELVVVGCQQMQKRVGIDPATIANQKAPGGRVSIQLGLNGGERETQLLVLLVLE